MDVREILKQRECKAYSGWNSPASSSLDSRAYLTIRPSHEANAINIVLLSLVPSGKTV